MAWYKSAWRLVVPFSPPCAKKKNPPEILSNPTVNTRMPRSIKLFASSEDTANKGATLAAL
ncbi:MAG: hypothetical protein BWY17_00233 [Deltaproteobacteria bacterium ADurb.Bin207]|nr:MAG: hypothetical protein BWY17_00233 [Deltaproteobacteria bacterium ADurb.Bin207]